MTAISILLSDQLAKDSQRVAKALGISRALFIRQAIIHELQYVKAQAELKQMATALSSMKSDLESTQEATEIEEGFNEPLPKEDDEWWVKK